MPSPLPRRTLADWTPEAGDVTEWLAQPHKPVTRASYASLVKHQITPHLGRKRLHDLTPMDIRRWHKALTGEVSPSTILKAHRVLDRQV